MRLVKIEFILDNLKYFKVDINFLLLFEGSYIGNGIKGKHKNNVEFGKWYRKNHNTLYCL